MMVVQQCTEMYTENGSKSEFYGYFTIIIKNCPGKILNFLNIRGKIPTTAGSYMFLPPQHTAHNTSESLLAFLPNSNLIEFQKVACSVLPWPVSRSLSKSLFIQMLLR